MSQSSSAFETATDGATVTFDFNQSHNWEVTLGGNRTFAFQNPVAGAVYHIKVTQDATGSRTITLPSAAKTAGTLTLTATAGRTDLLKIVYDGSKYLVSATLNYNLA